MGKIELVEYEPSLASAIADMWTESQDNWGGSSAVTTEEEVLQQEAKSSNLNTYVALDGDKAVGYCGLSEFTDDYDTLYIPLLNVRETYHGLKVGKRLVLKAVERTIELGWPRLDLHTWPGNTKAVPLYKKCGFFWEERDDATRLMNFIPTVLATEAVGDFFDNANWYQDSTRPIEITPDGHKEDGFDYFEYRWQKDKHNLRIEFERKGRGIRLIETDDYVISTTVEGFKLVSGGRYTIRYDVVNKSGKPLEISLHGIDHQNITYDFSYQSSIKNYEVIEGTFHVGEISEEQNPNKTHPAVTTNIKINEKKAQFKTGIMPKPPANVRALVPGAQHFTGVLSTFYLQMESNMQEMARFRFSLPVSPIVQFEKRDFQVQLKAGEKTSFPVSYRLNHYGCYQQDVDFSVATKGGEELTFSKKITAAFQGIGVRFTVEDDEGWHLFNGGNRVTLDNGKHMNLIFLFKKGQDSEARPSIVFSVPKLGKPYSDELSRIKPENVEFFERDGTVGLRATYASKAFPYVHLISNVKLYAEGLIEHWYEVQNRSAEPTAHHVWLNSPVIYDLYRPVLPYNGEIITVDAPVQQYYEYWESNRVTENWLFSRREDREPLGICWSENDEVKFEDWFLYFEHNFGKLTANTAAQTASTWISIGAFGDWRDFQSFARGQNEPEDMTTARDIQFNVNGHNPVVQDEVEAELKDVKSSYLNGSAVLRTKDEALDERSFAAKDQLHHVALHGWPADNKPYQLLKLDAYFQTGNTKSETLILRPDQHAVTTKEIARTGVTSYEAANGCIKLKAAPGFFPALYSIQYEDKEWLHHAFPETIAKSWWNPWPGGIGDDIEGLSAHSLAKANHSAGFESLSDQYGNEWSGIVVETEIEEHEEYKGLRFHQYFLMLPGVPVVCHTTKIVQNTHQYLDFKKWHTDAFLNADWLKVQNNSGEWQKYHTNRGEVEARADRSLIFGMNHCDSVLQVVADSVAVRTDFYLNKEVTTMASEQNINAEHGKRFFTKPLFLLLTNDIIPDSALYDLKNIRFSF